MQQKFVNPQQEERTMTIVTAVALILVIQVIANISTILIVLKMNGAINWPWLWVVSPLWLPPAAVIGFIIIALSSDVINSFRKL
jgi:hypothetical protein